MMLQWEDRDLWIFGEIEGNVLSIDPQSIYQLFRFKHEGLLSTVRGEPPKTPWSQAKDTQYPRS